MPLKPIVSICFLALLISFFSFNPGSEIKPGHVFHQMYDSIKSIKTLRQKVIAIERAKDHFNTNRSEVKIQTHPRKLYFHNPTKKIEILHNAEVYGNKAWVKPNVFPYLTIMLDPSGSIMRKDQHYSIHELGYDFIGKSVALTISKDKEGLTHFTYKGKTNKNGYNCFLIEYENKNYTYTKYVVGEKETATLIAYKLCINEYILRDKNDLLNDYGYIKKGTILKVPTLYCQKAVIFIDEKMMLPVYLSMYDEAGLFESYEYTQVIVNKPFKPNEFLKEFPEYGF
jgi:hypothetical protein